MSGEMRPRKHEKMTPRNHEITKTYPGLVSWFRVFVADRLRVFVVAFVLVAGLRVSVLHGGQADRGDAERGRQTFMRVGCYQCHGREAQGASTGPRLGPNPLPFAAFTRAVRTPRNEMPPYGVRILSDRELADVYAFVAARLPARQLPR
jgi:mono/diheme cytochrome c family protein